MSAQLQERKASKMLDGMRTVNTAGKYNAPAKEGEEEPTPVELVAPMYLTVVETGNNWAKADWQPVADESEWKIRLTQPIAAGSQTWGFDDGTVGEWTNVDADEDGRKWINVSGTSYEQYCYDSNGAIVSQSYYNGALTPDNWLISPQVTLGGTFTLYARVRVLLTRKSISVFSFLQQTLRLPVSRKWAKLLRRQTVGFSILST